MGFGTNWFSCMSLLRAIFFVLYYFLFSRWKVFLEFGCWISPTSCLQSCLCNNFSVLVLMEFMPFSSTVLPSFSKTPRDSTIRTGHTAKLECAAEGHPAPQIAWQKDGGTDFPAARERRMHVMPDDDVFFIMDVKPEDMGVYSCTAKNTAGTISANATLTVLGKSCVLLQLIFILIYLSLYWPVLTVNRIPTYVHSSAVSWECLMLQNKRLYIILFSAAVALLQVRGQRSQLDVKGGWWVTEGDSQRGVC